MVTIAAVLAIGLLVAWIWSRLWIVTAGRVMAKEVRVTAVAPARVAAIHVRSGQKVSAGEPLADLEVGAGEFERTVNVRKAELALNGKKLELDQLVKNGVDPTFDAAVQAADLELRASQQDRESLRSSSSVERTTPTFDASNEYAEVARQRKLLALRATTREKYNEAVVRLNKALASGRAKQVASGPRTGEMRLIDSQIREAEHRLRVAKARLDFAKLEFNSDIEKLKLEVQRWKDELEAMQEWDVSQQLLAPSEGEIGWLGHQPGEVIDKDDVLMTIINPSEKWVEAYVHQSDLTRFADGDTAKVKFAGIDGEFTGRVSTIYPDESMKFRNVEVGLQLVRSPSQLKNVYHTIRIDIDEPLPGGLKVDSVAKVKIKRN